jgi:peptidoglycan/LPS O-acetylase OafA/YrhL
MRLRTDDDIYRARLVYLGPPGYTLPVQLPYAQYGLFVVLVPIFMFVHYLFTFTVDLFPAWEIALAIVATSLVFRFVDPDRPARMVIRTALTDWRHTREPRMERREPRLVATRVHIREELR